MACVEHMDASAFMVLASSNDINTNTNKNVGAGSLSMTGTNNTGGLGLLNKLIKKKGYKSDVYLSKPDYLSKLLPLSAPNDGQKWAFRTLQLNNPGYKIMHCSKPSI